MYPKFVKSMSFIMSFVFFISSSFASTADVSHSHNRNHNSVLEKTVMKINRALLKLDTSPKGFIDSLDPGKTLLSKKDRKFFYSTFRGETPSVHMIKNKVYISMHGLYKADKSVVLELINLNKGLIKINGKKVILNPNGSLKQNYEAILSQTKNKKSAWIKILSVIYPEAHAFEIDGMALLFGVLAFASVYWLSTKIKKANEQRDARIKVINSNQSTIQSHEGTIKSLQNTIQNQAQDIADLKKANEDAADDADNPTVDPAPSN